MVSVYNTAKVWCGTFTLHISVHCGGVESMSPLGAYSIVSQKAKSVK